MPLPRTAPQMQQMLCANQLGSWSGQCAGQGLPRSHHGPIWTVARDTKTREYFLNAERGIANHIIP
jgi:hypothetical protein